MGLFDGVNFDPRLTGGGGGGGIFSMLHDLMQQQQNAVFGGQPQALQQQVLQQAPQQAPTMPAPQAAPQESGGGLFGGMGDFLSNHSNALIGLGAGIAGGHNWGQGISQGLTGAAQGRQLDLNAGNQAATYKALIGAGVPAAMAQAAALNPKLLDTVAPEYFGGPKVVKVGSGPLGDKMMVQKAGGKFEEIPGVSGTSMGLAPGVSKVDDTLNGEDYLNQFSPEVKAATKAYINGDVMPTGNPRNNTIATQAKTVAQKYGQDLGIPVSDEKYRQKSKMQVDLASSGNSSMGGILANGKSAFAHLADASDKLADLGNSSSDIPFVGGAYAATKNWFNNTATPTSNTKGKLAAANDALGHYGQESTKYYAGTGGGVEERHAALKNANPKTTSGAEQAAYLGTEKGLMLDRLQQKENQIRDIMGDKYLEEHPVMTTELKGTIARIDANIAKLKGDQPAQQIAPNSSSGIPAGSVSLLKSNPSLADQFDAKYGKGSAAKIIGGQ